MLRTLVIATLLASAASARADDCDATDPAGGTWSTAIAATFEACEADPQCAKTGRAPDHLPELGRHGGFVELDADAAATSQARTAARATDAAAGGEVAAHFTGGWHAGPQVCVRTDVVAGTESHGDTAVQVALPIGFSGVSFGGEQRWQLRPALDASRVWLRRAYTVDEVHVGGAMILWASGSGASDVFPLRETAEIHEQDSRRAVFETWQLGAYEHTDADGRVEVLPWTHEAMYPDGPGTDAAPKPASSWLDRLDLVDITHRFGDTTVELAGGWLWSSQPLSCRACAPIAVTAAVTGPAGRATWSVRAERSAQLAMDDTVTVEDRLSAGVAYPLGGVDLRASAFAALTRTTDAPAPVVTGGGALGLDVDLPAQVQLAVDAAVARSYYGRLDADPSPAPELAALGTVKLERHFIVLPPRG